MHGMFDTCLENAMTKCVHLGLHGGLPQLVTAADYHISAIKNYKDRPFRNKYNGFSAILSASLLSMAYIKKPFIQDCMTGLLDEMYSFTKTRNFDIYISAGERAALKGVPPNWKKRGDFIQYDLVDRFGFCFPLIYDIMGLYVLYDLNDPQTDKKINEIIDFISNDDFHTKISAGYGILIADPTKRIYHGMGWSPHYPGWFDVADCLDKADANTGALILFFAEYISNYPIAAKTKWFAGLTAYLEKYKTENGTYIFPKEWLPEKTGYAVNGFHMSYGENRRKKNWCEIESTFYIQSLQKNA
jgi:hypothetical protein